MPAITAPKLNVGRIKRFCALARTLQIGEPLNFYSITLPDGKVIVEDRKYPPLHAPWAIDFFFLAMAHNYGYWYGEKRYESPLVGVLNGKTLKGSDLLWSLFLAAFAKDPRRLTGGMLLELTIQDWRGIMTDDNGVVPLLASDERLMLTHDLARSLKRNASAMTGGEFIRYATEHSTIPARLILDALTHPTKGIAGYCEDPLKKKAMLLLMALINRPERFVVPEAYFEWMPIIDYHVMRVLLRMGLVILPAEWKKENVERLFTSPEREMAVRKACYDCVLRMIKGSDLSMPGLDQLLWMARKYCPETELPKCPKCALFPICGRWIDFFQPMIRTTYY